MKFFTLLLGLCAFTAWAQQPQPFLQHRYEDHSGKRITDPELIKRYAQRHAEQLEVVRRNQSQLQRSNLSATPLCVNGNFEVFDAQDMLLQYICWADEPLNPIQCVASDNVDNQGVPRYNPNVTTDLNATTVPANHQDAFIGDIHGFDQYALKINYQHTGGIGLATVRTQRFKSDNEKWVKFNYKAVLQSIDGTDHDNEQPFFKARVINQAGMVVSNFCLIGDPNNCIFTQAPVLEEGSIILYTPNWQAGYLDISSIPNNEDFYIEFMASRCGLGGHFGYAYVDDICNLHASENLQGSIELDPMNWVCPTLPKSVCGSFTLPNSGNVVASIHQLSFTLHDASGQRVYNSITPTSVDLVNHRFCFEVPANAPLNVNTGTYEASVQLQYDDFTTVCTGTHFDDVSDDDANPGWDIWYLNCSQCLLALTPATLKRCDNNHDGTETFDLTVANTLVAGNTPGLTFTYFESVTDATAHINPIANPNQYLGSTKVVFIRADVGVNCFKITSIQLLVRDPVATISGILNVCAGATTLTASAGSQYTWNGGQTSASIQVSTPGTYSVAVVDADGCSAQASVTIAATSVAVSPSLTILQPGCVSLDGQITVTSAMSSVSFDGGTTWQTSPDSGPLQLGIYQVIIRTASGCQSYATSVQIATSYAPFPNVHVVQPAYCGDLGSITVTSASSAYSFDNGVTWTDNPVSPPLPIGTYHVRIKGNDGCFSNDNVVTFFSEFLSEPTATHVDPYCGQLGSITVTSLADQYSIDGGTTWQSSPIFNGLDVGSYIVKIKDNQGCTSPNIYVYLYYFEDSYPMYSLSNAGCGIYGRIEINMAGDHYSFDGGMTWQTSPVLDQITHPQNFIIVVKHGSCLSLTRNISFYSNYYPLPDVHPSTELYCDNANDATETIDLTAYASHWIANPALYNYYYFHTEADAHAMNGNGQIFNGQQAVISTAQPDVWVVVEDAHQCQNITQVHFDFYEAPRIQMSSSEYICAYHFITLDAGPGFDTYTWSNQIHTQTSVYGLPGTKWVTVSQWHHNHEIECFSTQNVNLVLSDSAQITHIYTTDWTPHDNTIEVEAQGLGQYEYSLDGIHYQSSPLFTGLEPGEYQVYVNDVHGCGQSEVRPVFLLYYPPYFTPNGDGSHDYWQVDFARFKPGLKVHIFNRFGKFLKELPYNSEGWDGLYNGLPCPSDDYWFVVLRENGMVYRGHFALKR